MRRSAVRTVDPCADGHTAQVPWTRIERWPEYIELLKETGYVVAGMTLGDHAITLDELVAKDH